MARTLSLRARGRKSSLAGRPLPPLLFVTDPQRIADPVATARRLPRGAGIVYRAFGRPDARAVGLHLAAVARARGLVLLVGADEGLAAAIGADGVHLPERDLHRAPRLRSRRRRWLITGAVHGARALARGAAVDALLLSAVFESRSASATRALGTVRFAALLRSARAPVYALGGVNARTAPRLGATGAVGLAAVDGVDESGSRPQQP